MPSLESRADTIAKIHKLLDVHDLACKPVGRALAMLEAEISPSEIEMLHGFVLEVVHRLVHNKELAGIETAASRPQ